MSRVQWLEVNDEEAGQRLDNYLMKHLKKVPKTLVYRIIRKGEVRVNKGRCQASQRVQAGDVVRVPPVILPAEGQVVAPPKNQVERIEQYILYEDKDLLAVNKPSGIAVHGGSGVSWGLIELVRAARPLAKRIELVHRLDRDTSGVILLAKKTSVLRDLHEQIRANKVVKRYMALVTGQWPDTLNKVDLPLQKNTLRSGERMVEVDSEGKPSLTYFEVLAHYERASLLKVTLETGRTHQIRVHCQASKHPIIGDQKYGDEAVNRDMKALGMGHLALHSYQMGIRHPVTQEWLEIEAPLFHDFENIIKRLAKGE
jgi:23S rRNA pseudouridine955/2504/2580 synthase